MHINDGAGISGERADFHVMRDFLNGLLDYVRKGIADGKSQDEIILVEQLPGFPDHFHEEWKGAVPRCLTRAYEELTEE